MSYNLHVSECSIDGCGKKAVGRGYCPMHWRRWRLYGDPHARLAIRGDDVARFWSKVTQAPGCWAWDGPPDRDGYSIMRLGRTHVKAHRFAYELLVGPIPVGLVLDHGCRNRACVNPAHLEPVTNGTNTLRGETFVAANAAKTHCKRGHEFTPENTRLYRGLRICRTCAREHVRQQRRAQQANASPG